MFNEELMIYIRDKIISRLCQSFDSSFVGNEEFSENVFVKIHGASLRGAADVQEVSVSSRLSINCSKQYMGIFLP